MYSIMKFDLFRLLLDTQQRSEKCLEEFAYEMP